MSDTKDHLTIKEETADANQKSIEVKVDKAKVRDYHGSFKLEYMQADAIAQQEFASKYPGKKPSTFAQRKISNKGVSVFTLMLSMFWELNVYVYGFFNDLYGFVCSN